MKEEIKRRVCRDDRAREYHSRVNGFDVQTVEEIKSIIETMSEGGRETLMGMLKKIDSLDIYEDLKQDGKSTIFFLQNVERGYSFSISAGVGSIN